MGNRAAAALFAPRQNTRAAANIFPDRDSQPPRPSTTDATRPSQTDGTSGEYWWSVPSPAPVTGTPGRAGGQRLEASVAAKFSNRFGYDLSGVRVHTDTAAAKAAERISALAFTESGSISFAEGRYAPSTPHGERLIAHELAHVVQQSRVGTADLATAEREASLAGRLVAAGMASPSLGPAPRGPLRESAEGNFPDPATLVPERLYAELRRMSRWLAEHQENSAAREDIELRILPAYVATLKRLTERQNLPPPFLPPVKPGDPPDPVADALAKAFPQPGLVSEFLAPPQPKVQQAPKPAPLNVQKLELIAGNWSEAFALAFIRSAGSDPKLQAHWNRLRGQVSTGGGAAKFTGGMTVGLATGAVISIADIVYAPLKLAVEFTLESNLGHPTQEQVKEWTDKYIGGLKKLMERAPEFVNSILTEPARWGDAAGHFLTAKIRQDIFYEPEEKPQQQQEEKKSVSPLALLGLKDVAVPELTELAKSAFTVGQGAARADHVYNIGFAMGEAVGYALMQVAMLFIGLEELQAIGASAKALKETKLGRALAEAIAAIPELKPLSKAPSVAADAATAAKEASVVTGAAEAAAKVPEATPIGAAKGSRGLPKALDDVTPGTRPVGDLAERRAAAARKPPTEPAAQPLPKAVEQQEQVAIGQTHGAGNAQQQPDLYVVRNEPTVSAAPSGGKPTGHEVVEVGSREQIVEEFKARGGKVQEVKPGPVPETTEAERVVTGELKPPEGFDDMPEFNPKTPKQAGVGLAEDHHIATKYRKENKAIFERLKMLIDDDLNLIVDFEEHGQLRGWYDWNKRGYKKFYIKGHHREYNAWVTKLLKEASPEGLPPDKALKRVQKVLQELNKLVHETPELLSHGPGLSPKFQNLKIPFD